ncbi:MAG: hypothetical protein AB7U76_26045, partial [Pirellulales bacterium]
MRTIAVASAIWLAIGAAVVLAPVLAELVRIAIAARDAVRAVIVLATLAEGPGNNAELRRATGHPGDSFRSLLRRMERAGLIVARPCTPRRWTRVSAPCYLATG